MGEDQPRVRRSLTLSSVRTTCQFAWEVSSPRQCDNATMRDYLRTYLVVFVWDFGSGWLPTHSTTERSEQRQRITIELTRSPTRTLAYAFPMTLPEVQVVFRLDVCAAISRIFYGANFDNSGNRVIGYTALNGNPQRLTRVNGKCRSSPCCPNF